ncbi:MAG: hypothetical protein HZB65_00780 [Candidatus Aenigmarchaeota archaeon]|nr:hypothetical protein [Candidatus Aenigmarchaeota archaeon]
MPSHISDIINNLPAYVPMRTLTAAYIEALHTLPFVAKRFMTAGGDSTVFELEYGILKLSDLCYPTQRSFDIPRTAEGKIVVRNEPPAYYIIQPRTLVDVSDKDVERAIRIIEKPGFIVTDPEKDNFGYYNNRVFLIDPFAVETAI